MSRRIHPLLAPRLSRRRLLGAAALGLAAPSLILRGGVSAAEPAPFVLRPAPAEAPLAAPEGPSTRAWLYNGVSPGPILRGRQGETLRIRVENGLETPTTVHWHGLRVPVEMDGVPYLSQAPIEPGAAFDYALPLADAGTFWYHPHFESSEQVGRGLHGVLIVDEPPEIAARLGADRELVWALGDWRLDRAAQILPFGEMHDASHGGRIGSMITVNGSIAVDAPVRAGERIRLRLANVANARTFRLGFGALEPWLVALDGHPVPPQRLTAEDRVTLGSGQRADLALDVPLTPGAVAEVRDDAYGPRREFVLMRLVVDPAAAPLRAAPPPAPEGLAPNPIARPDLAQAVAHRLTFEGGAMGGMMGGGGMGGGGMGDMHRMVATGQFWTVNGRIDAHAAHYVADMPPLLDLALGASHVVTLENRTNWPHPIHLHGHAFFILREGADPLAGAPIRDTVLLAPQETARIAFVADNPGKWMVHCHILEHQSTGMMGVAAVA